MQIDIQCEKNILRKDILKRRNNISNSDRESRSRKILNRLISLAEIKIAKNVCVYVSKGSEADTICLIEKLISMGKSVYAPKSEIKSNSMTFYKINSLSELSIGAFSVLEPNAKCEEYICSDKCDICIVPAISFDIQGFRLGYGKGYYDRFLVQFKGIKIGICFEEFITEMLPRLDTDIAVDMIITENKNILCKGGR